MHVAAFMHLACLACLPPPLALAAALGLVQCLPRVRFRCSAVAWYHWLTSCAAVCMTSIKLRTDDTRIPLVSMRYPVPYKL
jgi:hypothetical protein